MTTDRSNGMDIRLMTYHHHIDMVFVLYYTWRFLFIVGSRFSFYIAFLFFFLPYILFFLYCRIELGIFEPRVCVATAANRHAPIRGRVLLTFIPLLRIGDKSARHESWPRESRSLLYNKRKKNQSGFLSPPFFSRPWWCALCRLRPVDRRRYQNKWRNTFRLWWWWRRITKQRRARG